MPGMHDSAVKIRRGKRTDLIELQKLLAAETTEASAASATAGPTHARHWRRLAGDPSLDFYVLEYEGTVLGMLLVSYVRELREYGWQAIIDTVLATVLPANTATPLGQHLLDFAKARARRRGCRRVLAWRENTMDEHHVAALLQGGFHVVGDMLSCDL